MNSINHTLWGATFGRTVGMPVQGAIAGGIADFATVPIFSYYFIFRKRKKFNDMPRWIKCWYSFLHNWLFAAVVCGVLTMINPRFLIFGVAYAWHNVEDAFVHTDYATPFLYPLWKGKITKFSAYEHKWVQWIDFLLIVVANIIIGIP